MARPRSSILNPDVTSYYHCTSRCVRGSFLCGVDRVTGCDYTHRRRWLRERLLVLSDTFSIKIAAFAIMENHFHTVLVIDSKTAENWSINEVVERWHSVFKGSALSQKFISGESLSKREADQLKLETNSWRKNLCSISWFMRCTKEPLARLANKEDQCKGRFWDGRFHCQALLDTKSLIACMTYVDLNPLRAKMCESPEEDKFTSLRLRLEKSQHLEKHLQRTLNLLQGTSLPGNHKTLNIPLTLAEYLNIIDTTARVVRSDKRGALSPNEVSIFQRLGFSADQWISAATSFNKYFHSYVGKRSSLLKALRTTGNSTIWGIRNCESLLGT